jgi:hypothetical protein
VDRSGPLSFGVIELTAEADPEALIAAADSRHVPGKRPTQGGKAQQRPFSSVVIPGLVPGPETPPRARFAMAAPMIVLPRLRF